MPKATARRRIGRRRRSPDPGRRRGLLNLRHGRFLAGNRTARQCRNRGAARNPARLRSSVIGGLSQACRHCCSPRRGMSLQATCRGCQGRLPRIPLGRPRRRARSWKVAGSLAQSRVRGMRSPQRLRGSQAPSAELWLSFPPPHADVHVAVHGCGGDAAALGRRSRRPASRNRARPQGSWRRRPRPPAGQAPLVRTPMPCILPAPWVPSSPPGCGADQRGAPRSSIEQAAWPIPPILNAISPAYAVRQLAVERHERRGGHARKPGIPAERGRPARPAAVFAKELRVSWGALPEPRSSGGGTASRRRPRSRQAR